MASRLLALEPDEVKPGLEILNMVTDEIASTSDDDINWRLDSMRDVVHMHKVTCDTIEAVDPDNCCHVLSEIVFMTYELLRHYKKYRSFENFRVEGCDSNLDSYDDTPTVEDGPNVHGSTAALAPAAHPIVAVITEGSGETGVVVESRPRPMTPEPRVLPLPSQLSVVTHSSAYPIVPSSHRYSPMSPRLSSPSSPLSPSTIRVPLSQLGIPIPIPIVSSHASGPTLMERLAHIAQSTSGVVSDGVVSDGVVSDGVVSNGGVISDGVMCDVDLGNDSLVGIDSIECDDDMLVDLMPMSHSMYDQLMYIDLCNE
jgi:hypothetical protein